jgi:hypothetical protein
MRTREGEAPAEPCLNCHFGSAGASPSLRFATLQFSRTIDRHGCMGHIALDKVPEKVREKRAIVHKKFERDIVQKEV